jgi:signal peptidase I
MARPVNELPDDTGTVGPERSPEWFGSSDDAADAPANAVPNTDPARGRHAAPGRGGRSRLTGASRWRKGVRWTIEVVAVVLIAVLAITALRVFIAQPFYIPGAAMEPTLAPGDRVLSASIATQISGVQRGDVIAFTDPGGWLPSAPASTGFGAALTSGLEFIGLLPDESGNDMILRVIGTGGDRIVCCDAQGRIELNGAALIEPYLAPGVRTDQVLFDVSVPPDSVFVMGDNRAASVDSRNHLDVNNGAVPVSDVVGRVVFVLWPFSSLGPVSQSSAFAQVPPVPQP